MAVIASRKKQVRKNVKKTHHNKHLKSSIRTNINNFNNAVLANDTELAHQAYKEATKLLDKSVSKNVHNKNFVNRKKSALRKAYNELT